MLRQTSAYVKGHDGQTKWMHFLIKDDKLLKKYTIWDNVNADRKKIASKSVYKIFFENQSKVAW